MLVGILYRFAADVASFSAICYNERNTMRGGMNAMAKVRTRYVCGECGYESTRWLGRCPDCGSWNSLGEEAAPERLPEKKLRRKPGAGAQVIPIDQVPRENMGRILTGVGELDRVLGGGAVEGSMLLVGGDPGIGKSTLLTQVSANLSNRGKTVLYVSGEESARQIGLRAKRLGALSSGFYVLAENDLDVVMKRLEETGPGVCIVDSIQTMYLPDMASAPGSVSQVRECAGRLMRYAKLSGCIMILVGHVTKEGAIAGPRVLEHMVDAVLYFEGDRQHEYRLLRAVKNRFGSVNELGMFEMTGEGMVEVPNASEALLSERAHDMSGSAVLCTVEGTRPVLADVQALVSTTVFGNPRRMASGVEQGRLALLLAVLEKRAGIPLYNQDVYVNIAGGLQLSEPAADLALCAAIASSAKNRVLDPSCALMGEVGLAGEVRAVGQIERRIGECVRLGFDRIMLPQGNMRRIKVPEEITLIPVRTVAEAMAKLL